MSSTNGLQRPQEAVVVATRYLRRERPLSGLLAIFVVSLYLATYRMTSLLPAIGVAALLVILARAPILQSRGSVRLQTDDDSETVVDAFSGPTPPVLAFQWGIADEVTTETDTATYRTSYLFGLRTAVVTVDTQTGTTSNGVRTVELEISANDKPWATYTATITPKNEQTVVDVEYTSPRRFGLRRLPQQFLAERYRNEALAVQGYTVVERDSHFGF